jgi:DUF971 family protein
MSSGFESPGALPDPARVSVSKSKGVTIDWRDGHRSHYELKYLRDHCPCATCTGGHAAGPAPSPFPMFKPALRLEGVEAAGHYALRLLWSDGHNTGIYTWDYLRSLCPCAECRSRG